MTSAERPLLIEPVVSRPREAEVGRTYLVTVDLRGPLGLGGDGDGHGSGSGSGSGSGPEWPYQDEEFTFTVGLDGSPHFICEVLDDPSVVLHRFGGTYGPARFVVTAGRTAGPASLWLTISNQWGMPVRKAELRCRIRESGPGAGTGAGMGEGAGAGAEIVGYLPEAPGGVSAHAPEDTPDDTPARAPREVEAPPGASGEAPGAPDTRDTPDGPTGSLPEAPPRRRPGRLRAILDRALGNPAESRRGAPRSEAPTSPPTERTGAEAPESVPESGTESEPERRPERRPERGRERRPARGPEDSGAPSGQDILIVFAGFDRAWASWIGDRLERRGVRVTHLRWNPPPETPLAEALRELPSSRGRILLVLSDAFLQLGPRGHDEWNSALREVTADRSGRFTAVSVTGSALPTATSVLAPVELIRLNAVDAERRLLLGLGLPRDYPPDRAAGRGPRYPAGVPEVWGGVPRRNIRFTGREELLDRTRRLLAEWGETSRVVLVGMSGVGKTQLAAEYVHRFGSDYDLVWWVSADRRSILRQQLADLAPVLGLATGVEYGERLRAVRDALRRGDPYARWLLILDGADDIEAVADLVPTGPGHVLITSRHPDWDRHPGVVVEVPAYTRDESVDFVRRRAPRLTHAEADQLAASLGDLPLLLDQTAGWLNESGMPVEAYTELLRDDRAEDAVSVSADFPTAFRTAWAILLNTLRETVPESVDLLRLCTFFAPGTIPVRLIRDLPPEALPDRLRPLVEDSERWARAVGKLREYAVVRVLGDDERGGPDPAGAVELPGTTGGDPLYLHRMVHQIAHQDMLPEDHREFIEVARRALTLADPGNPADTRLWPRYAEITPHLKWADVLRSTDLPIHTLVLNCLRYMYLSGEYGSGIRLAERAMAGWRELLGPTHPRIWDLSHHYGNLLRAIGDYHGSEALDRAASEYWRAEHGVRNLEYLRAAGGLAADLRGLGRYQDALELSRHTLGLYASLVGEEDARTLTAQNNLGVSLRLLGRYEEALEVDRRTLAIRSRQLPPRHSWTLYSEINQAIDRRLLGRYREAEAIQELSVRTHRQVLGADNPQTLRAEHNLALCRYHAGDRAGARPLFGEVLARCERVLGEEDPLTTMIATSCAWVERELGDLDRALTRHEEVERRYSAMLGPAHPFTVGVRGNKGLTLLALGERDAGREEIERTYTGMCEAVGAGHPWAVGCALNTAAARTRTGDHESAAPLSRDTVERALRALGREHPLTLLCQVGLAGDLRALRRIEEAGRTEEEALNGLAATLGARHPVTAGARQRVRPHWDFEPLII
ncbi:FxSxx-COOH system tetratricopeptide repeat protein [Streptomyces sp. NPDC050804]|uniref:FxSxx-COOH system tetratricopeptide repeat protein n=1 Tax=Streptomyces sp. NPDC050804 TaxID=3154745 RepID=UPI0034275055